MLLLKNIEFSVFLQGTTTATTTNLTNHNLYEGMFAELDSNLIRMMIIKKCYIFWLRILLDGALQTTWAHNTTSVIV